MRAAISTRSARSPGSCSSDGRRFRERASSRSAASTCTPRRSGPPRRFGARCRRMWRTSFWPAWRRILRAVRETPASFGAASSLARCTAAGKPSTRRAGGERRLGTAFAHRRLDGAPDDRPRRGRPRDRGPSPRRVTQRWRVYFASVERFDLALQCAVEDQRAERNDGRNEAASQRRAGQSYSRTTR